MRYSYYIGLGGLLLTTEASAWKFRVHHMIARIAYDILASECPSVLETATDVLKVLH